MPHILYLTYDLADPTTAKRVRMLVAGGATVSLAGFRRAADEVTEVAGCPATDLGRTHNQQFLQRAWLVIREMLGVARHRALFTAADIIIARNLEMLAIAVAGRSLCNVPSRLVYESLDIHRLLLREDIIGQSLRMLEGWLSRRCRWLITSSPAFVSEYFEKQSQVRLPVMLLENKVLQLGEYEHLTSPFRGEVDASASGGGSLPDAQKATPTRPAGDLPPEGGGKVSAPPWRIGWFGIIRCRKSLAMLCALAREHPHLVEIVIRGRPAYDQFEDFDAQVSGIPNLHFLGSYRNPEDLAAMYQEVHFTWAIDMFEEGQNSQWLLPNRLYESCFYGVVPLAAEGVETSHFIERLGIGHTLAEPKAESLVQFLSDMTPQTYARMRAEIMGIPRSVWVHGRDACVALVAGLASGLPTPTPANHDKPLLVVIPCLNESSHIEALIHYLRLESASVAMRIVVADGGSTDGTIEIIKRLAAKNPDVHYLHNPRRIQSAALNLAIATYGGDAELLIRLDAHAEYPAGFCAALLREAASTLADSVVVSMTTVGNDGFQEAVAAAQNSRLGNGGSAHRCAMNHGKWVEHGHHALMRIAAYRAVGGYDETFSHNEDAELDARLRKAGYRLWLTAKTTCDYFPRATPLALFLQYRKGLA